MGNVNTLFTEHKGVKFKIDIDHDPDATLAEFDCYSDEDKAKWKNDDWMFVDITVTPKLPDIGYASQVFPPFMLGAVHYGEGDDWTVTGDDIRTRAVEEGWCDEAISAVRDEAAKVIAAIQRFVAMSSVVRHDSSRPDDSTTV